VSPYSHKSTAIAARTRCTEWSAVPSQDAHRMAKPRAHSRAAARHGAVAPRAKTVRGIAHSPGALPLVRASMRGPSDRSSPLAGRIAKSPACIGNGRRLDARTRLAGYKCVSSRWKTSAPSRRGRRDETASQARNCSETNKSARAGTVSRRVEWLATIRITSAASSAGVHDTCASGTEAGVVTICISLLSGQSVDCAVSHDGAIT